MTETRQARSDEELKDLAIKFRAGKLITDRQVPKDCLNMVFMPVMLMHGPPRDELIATLEAGGLIYAIEGEHKQVPARYYNGWPIFVEFSVLDNAERERLNGYLEKLEAL